MSHRDDYPHGVPCWVTCLADDVHEAIAFYGALFGWTADYSPEEDWAVALLDGREVAGIGPARRAGPEVRPAWMTEIRVDDVAAASARVAGAGGTVVAEPMDLSPAGKLSVFADPGGAVACLFEAGGRRGAQTINAPGAWAMSALQTSAADASAAFYGDLLGWETEPFGPATLFRLPGYVGGEPEQPVARDVVAAMVPGDEQPAVWGVNFWVDDADAAANAATANGGAVLSAPTDQGIFREAVLADPGGAVFSVSQMLVG